MNGRQKRVFEYDNYRLFLKDMYLSLKAEDPKFSFRYFSRAAGFSSPNVLKKVIDGLNNLTEDSALRFAKVLKLNKEETAFFQNLVLLNQAKSDAERLKHAQNVMRSRLYKAIHPLSEAQYNYFSKWYYLPVRELVGLPGFKEDYHWVAHAIVPNITSNEARRAVEELLKLGLLKRDENGKLKQAEANLTTPDVVANPSIANYHREMLKKASEAIEGVPKPERDISAVAFPVSAATAGRIKEMIYKFRREIVEVASQDDSPDRIYFLNLQLFPVVKVSGTEGS